MDTLTHGLVGALIGRISAAPDAPGSLPVRTRVWTGFLAGMFPDADFVVWFFNPQRYLLIHRGLTHSLVMLPLWSLLLSGVFALLYRGRYSWRKFVPLTAAAIAAHIGADVLTSFGTMIFAPLSDVRVSIPTTFIIDPYFTGIVAMGLVGSWAFPRSILPAGLAFALLAGYIGLEASLRAQAQDWGVRSVQGRGWEPAEVMALPQPLSPFNWEVVVARIGIHDPFHYRIAYVNLRAGAAKPGASGHGFLTRLWHAYAPLAHPHWRRLRFLNGSARARHLERQAWGARALRSYRRFSLFPFAVGTVGTKRQCVVFSDVRFLLPVARAPHLVYEVCRHGGRWSAPPTLSSPEGAR
ncbi:MAG: metal-dependent hydrolase [Acidiferrobacteraceae bacterium]